MTTELEPRICVSVCEHDPASLAQAMKAAADVGDLIEVRGDCIDPDRAAAALGSWQLLNKTGRPVILTYRPAEQGGHRQLDPRSRLRFWMFERPDTPEFYDVELAIVRNRSLFRFGKKLDWSRVICSHHNFSGLTSNLSAYLNRVYEGMRDAPAQILKLAVQIDDAVDCLPFFSLLRRAREEGREIIAIAMGPAGIMTRILGPSHGAFLTYASLDEASATAPGQITADDLRNVYRLHKIGPQSEITGLLGHPVLHSISPHLHNAGFAATGLDAVYIPFEVKDAGSFLKRMVHPQTRELDLNFKGLSVTAPHKTAVMDHLEWVEPAAQEIGAVNTIVVEGTRLCGYNTDAAALVAPLVKELGDLRSRNFAIIGAGGAAAAAIWSLRGAGANITLFARDEERAGVLAKRFETDFASLDQARFENFDVVINATPLGTAGPLRHETPVSGEQLRGAGLAYDLVYNPLETRFLSEARAAGCATLGGLSMLVEQAVAQFELWTKTPAPREAMLAAADRRLSGIA
ncbi:MAG TPA: shikimate dehydrogenase [Pyrinomonadaceae bacterium]|nr:shikimate dehydrogenase [Pyrinomonadaceae bacterium]